MRLDAIVEPGYHSIEIGGQRTVLAVAPSRCVTIADVAPGERVWGIAAQVYGLRHSGDCGIGDMAGVAALGKNSGGTQGGRAGAEPASRFIRRRSEPLQSLFAIKSAVLQSVACGSAVAVWRGTRAKSGGGGRGCGARTSWNKARSSTGRNRPTSNSPFIVACLTNFTSTDLAAAPNEWAGGGFYQLSRLGWKAPRRSCALRGAARGDAEAPIAESGIGATGPFLGAIRGARRSRISPKKTRAKSRFNFFYSGSPSDPSPRPSAPRNKPACAAVCLPISRWE